VVVPVSLSFVRALAHPGYPGNMFVKRLFDCVACMSEMTLSSVPVSVCHHMLMLFLSSLVQLLTNVTYIFCTYVWFLDNFVECLTVDAALI